MGTNWIRGSFWDGMWFLSGLPLGVLLTVMTRVYHVNSALIILLGFLAIDTGHTLSPIVLAWTHRGFRAAMLQRPAKFILFPLLVLGVSIAAAYAGGAAIGWSVHFNPRRITIADLPNSIADLRNSFLCLGLAYLLWNGYHFGKQNFGVMSIYRKKCDERGARMVILDRGSDALFTRRHIDLWYCCGVTWLAMLMPFIPRLAHGLYDMAGFPGHLHPFLDYARLTYFAVALACVLAMLWWEWRTTRSLPRAALILTNGVALVLIWFAGLWGFALIALNHWLTAIGLASHVQGNHTGRSPWLFALVLVGGGQLVFAALFIRPERYFEGWIWLSFTVTAVGVRLGLGFVHFLYDRWIWKMSNPLVRETIGRDLFLSTPKLSIAA